jgi:L,D-transpeptidase ErfK/SrfK
MTSLFNPDFLNPVVKNAIANKRHFLLAQTLLGAGLCFALSQTANAATFAMPNGADSLIDNGGGKPVYIKASRNDSLIDIAVDKLLGQEEIVRANKTVDRWLPGEGKEILIPSSYLLPDAPRQGIVINLPEYRLYYYPAPTPTYSPVALPKPPSLKSNPNTINSAPPRLEVPAPVVSFQPKKVISYSVGIGRFDWKTPLGVTKVIGKVQNPTWTPPASIKAEHLAKGDPLPDVWPAGPDNPLGLFAFRLGIPGYLLHSTNKPQGVGMQVSHGCMRLYPKDIEKMFPMVPIGTPVNIINQPVKVGWSNGELYIESHPNLEGEEITSQQRLDIALSLIEKARSARPVSINDVALKLALDESNGLPTVISGYGNDTSLQPTENFGQPPAATSPPRLDDSEFNNSGGVVPRSEIEKELLQEEMQERQFKNSPFPAY